MRTAQIRESLFRGGINFILSLKNRAKFFTLRIKLLSLCVCISSIFSLTHTGLAKRIQHHPTLLFAVENCRTRWSNECNMLDPEFWIQGSGTKIYPESLENKLSPCWRFQVPFKIINRVTLCDSKRTVVPETGNCNSKCPVSKGLAPCRCEEP